MFRALFARLTGSPRRGQALFGLAVATARQPDWYVQGEVPDTVNGRFAVLATIVSLLTVRLEQEGEAGGEASVALTERLVESLDAEIREMGLGDPTLGKQVRRLVGAVSGRVDRWREVTGGEEPWTAEVRRSLYLDEAAPAAAVEYGETALRRVWSRLNESSLDELAQGRMR
jgi:cytochrome b pre-mRNA-processing protein 3